MDYEQLYKYLNTRPIEEIKSCMENVVRLYQKKTDAPVTKVSNDDSEHTHSIDMQRKIDGLQFAQRAWTEQAVWNKFGSRTKFHTSLGECTLAVSSLLIQPSIASYIVTVSSMIDECLTNSTMTGKRKDLAVAHGTPKRNEVSPFLEAAAALQTTSYDLNSTLGSNSDDDEEDCSEKQYEPPRKRGKGPDVVRRRGSRWTPKMDDALRAAVDQHMEEGWDAVTEHVGWGVTRQQCYTRWTAHLEPLERGLKKGGSWSVSEIERLRELATKHTRMVVSNDGVTEIARVNWKAVGSELGRLLGE